MTVPKRIRLSRAKGFRLPGNAVNCARPGPLGNPFVVGKHGTREECVSLHSHLMSGLLCVTMDNVEAQVAHREYVLDHLEDLRGKDLACWCALDGRPCHGDNLLDLANAPRSVAA